MHSLRRKVLASVALAIALGAAATGALSSGRQARADGTDLADQNARCATRLAIALLGDAPPAALLASQTPQASVDAMVKDPDFLKEAAALNFDVAPVRGEAMQKIVAEVLATPKPLRERARPIIE